MEDLKIKNSPFSDRPDWFILGQSAPEREVKFSDLNDKQRRIVRLMYDLSTNNSVFTLKDLAKLFEGEAGSFKANSWVRNSLRLLVVGGWVIKTGKGEYVLSDVGRSNIRAW